MDKRNRYLSLLCGAVLLPAACGDERSPSSTSQAALCPDSPAEQLFEATACICEDFIDAGELLVGSGNPGDSAVFAVNGAVKFVNAAEIRGDLIAHQQLATTGDVAVTGTAETAGTASIVGQFDVGADLSVGGDLTGVGDLVVGGTLRVAGSDSFLGSSDIGAEADYGDTPDAPCGCDAGSLFDVAGAVAAAAQDNDNETNGVATELLSVGDHELTLTTGSYYIADPTTVGTSQVTIDGTVALFVDGDLRSVGEQTIALTPGSVLDLYVSGNVQSVGNVELGSSGDPAAFRLYIGGSEPATVAVGNTILNAAIYAPLSALHYVGDTRIRGAVFARELVGVGTLTLGHAAPRPGTDCPGGDDDAGDPPDGGDGGDDPGPLVL